MTQTTTETPTVTVPRTRFSAHDRGAVRVRIENASHVVVVRHDDKIECYTKLDGLEMFAGYLGSMPAGPSRTGFADLYSYGAHRH